MGLFSRKDPKIKHLKQKSDRFDGWLKCEECSELIHNQELEKNLRCCPKCQYHYPLNAKQRMELRLDIDSLKELFDTLTSEDPLKFVDVEKYKDRLKRAQRKTGLKEAFVCGKALIENIPVAFGVLDFSFLGGSMGSVVGEKITLLIEYACENHLPLVLVSSSGGARMQESILSLMQMAKTSSALTKLGIKKCPFISILAHPTTGGVTASFASLGDLLIAEPKALIAFAGPRVVEQTIKQQLPKEAQKSEFLKEHGFIDCIVERKQLKSKIAKCLSYFVE
ncbi:MAG: Acetyl-coenzyme A carboxylase carboxyl transferase subunit beta [Chlamydiae bacterium]|nr:Acetyl-coenzyme A carboxylase carboxyl transferase subunit beta [Chlamydiota bacterium]